MQTITISQTAKVLAFSSDFVRGDIDERVVRTWQAMLDGVVTFEEAWDAALEHGRTSEADLRPATVIAIAKRKRHASDGPIARMRWIEEREWFVQYIRVLDHGLDDDLVRDRWEADRAWACRMRAAASQASHAAIFGDGSLARSDPRLGLDQFRTGGQGELVTAA